LTLSVDGELKCERWIREDSSNTELEESRIKLLLNRLIGRPNEVSVDQPYPSAEGKQFVLSIIAGLEGYHINVDGRHVASFPYRTVS
jgi:hydroxyproline O-galactosyltransferase 2/3/4/5/6